MQGIGELADHALHPGLTSRYRIIRLLGSGGMGHVYLALDQELARHVAVKTIRPDLARDEHVRKRIDVECRLHAAIGMQPNIVALYDRIELDGFVYLILEYVDGILLSELLESEKSSLSSAGLAEKSEIIIQILTGLQAIHQKNILHRDIKPANVMVSNLHSGHPVVKLMDFGIAHAESEEDVLTRLTVVDSGGPGTPTYMAPERIDPQTFGEIGVAADLYSVGVILFQMLSDGPPFRGTVTEILMGHLTKSIDFSTLGPNLSVGIKKVVVRSLQKKQANRFADASSFAEALRKALVMVPVADSVHRHARVEETLLATDPRLTAALAERTVLDTGTFVQLSPHVKRRKRMLAAGAAAILVVAAAFLVMRYFDVLPKKATVESMPIARDSQAVSPSATVQENQASRPGAQQEQPQQQDSPSSERAGAGPDVVDTGNEPAEDENNLSAKKQSSAQDAFLSARTARVDDNPPERTQNNPTKTHYENRESGRPTALTRSEKANESTRKPNCQNLRKSWQLLGDPASMKQFRQECTN